MVIKYEKNKIRKQNSRYWYFFIMHPKYSNNVNSTNIVIITSINNFNFLFWKKKDISINSFKKTYKESLTFYLLSQQKKNDTEKNSISIHLILHE